MMWSVLLLSDILIDSPNTESHIMSARFITLITIVFSIAIFRLLPHLPNVSPVAAMALFGGAYFADKKLALLIPFVALLLSDLFLGFHSTMVFVYVSFAITVMLGVWISNNKKPTTIAIATLGSSVLFFLVTNFGAWLGHGMYPKTTEGLIQAYVAGIPFFQNTLMGDLFFSAVLFGGFALLTKNVKQLRGHSI